jgi:hypothetical protein
MVGQGSGVKTRRVGAAIIATAAGERGTRPACLARLTEDPVTAGAIIPIHVHISNTRLNDNRLRMNSTAADWRHRE